MPLLFRKTRCHVRYRWRVLMNSAAATMTAELRYVTADLMKMAELWVNGWLTRITQLVVSADLLKSVWVMGQRLTYEHNPTVCYGWFIARWLSCQHFAESFSDYGWVNVRRLAEFSLPDGWLTFLMKTRPNYGWLISERLITTIVCFDGWLINVTAELYIFGLSYDIKRLNLAADFSFINYWNSIHVTADLKFVWWLV